MTRPASAGSQKHIHFEQSDEEAVDAEEQLARPVDTANGSTPHPLASQPAAVSKSPVQAASLPAPGAAVSVVVQGAANQTGTTPAARAYTLAEVFAARSHATAAHANGRSSPQVAAGSIDPDQGKLPQGDAGERWQRTRRFVREPQVVHELLPVLQRQAQPGDVVSYRLLEISVDFTPQVRVLPFILDWRSFKLLSVAIRSF